MLRCFRDRSGCSVRLSSAAQRNHSRWRHREDHREGGKLSVYHTVWIRIINIFFVILYGDFSGHMLSLSWQLHWFILPMFELDARVLLKASWRGLRRTRTSSWNVGKIILPSIFWQDKFLPSEVVKEENHSSFNSTGATEKSLQHVHVSCLVQIYMSRMSYA